MTVWTELPETPARVSYQSDYPPIQKECPQHSDVEYPHRPAGGRPGALVSSLGRITGCLPGGTRPGVIPI